MPGTIIIVWAIAFPPASFGQTNQTKFIRLRNETIATLHTDKTAPSAPGFKSNLAATAAPASNGLFLIQFEDHPRAAWRAQLLALEVDLVKYVPDDAYIARFEDAVRAGAQVFPAVGADLKGFGESVSLEKCKRDFLCGLASSIPPWRTFR